MSSSIEKYNKKRLRSSYIYVVLSIALVLFVLGLLGIIVLQTNALAQHFKEQVSMSVFIKNNIDKASIKNFEKKLQAKTYVKQVGFISKDSAANELSKELGEDFVAFLGTNPLRDNVVIKLKSDYVTKDSIAKIKTELNKSSIVYEIDYNEFLIDQLDRNIKRITLWILVLSGILTMIAVMLIHSTIRLSIYSKRFIIKTMQMVGATKGFIRKPFIITGIKLGVFGALIAIFWLYLLALYFQSQIPDLKLTTQYEILVPVFGGVLLMGIIITGTSTYFATRRFLNLKTEELYD